MSAQRNSSAGAALILAALLGAFGGLTWALQTVPQPRCDAEQQRSCLLQHKYLPSVMKVVAGMAAGYAVVALFTVWVPEQNSRRRWETQRGVRIQRLQVSAALPQTATHAMQAGQRQARLRQPTRLPQAALGAVQVAQPRTSSQLKPRSSRALPTTGGFVARPRSEHRLHASAILPVTALQAVQRYQQENDRQ